MGMIAMMYEQCNFFQNRRYPCAVTFYLDGVLGLDKAESQHRVGHPGDCGEVCSTSS